jgi:hypothetical protein
MSLLFLSETEGAVQVVKLCKMFEIFMSFSHGLAVDPCMGVAEISISDAHKPHMLKSEGLLDTLRCGLFVDAGNTASSVQNQLRRHCCAVLSQLASLETTATALVGHPLLSDLADLLKYAKPPISRDISITLFQVSRVTGAAAAATTATAAAASTEHVMLSYNWDHQAVIKRVHRCVLFGGRSD